MSQSASTTDALKAVVHVGFATQAKCVDVQTCAAMGQAKALPAQYLLIQAPTPTALH